MRTDVLTETSLSSTFAITVLSAACIVCILRWFLRRPRNFPPGPFGLPVVGYLPFFSKKPFIDLIDLSKKYGKVFSLRVGSLNVVVLCDFLAIKEAMSKDAFLDRPPNIQIQGLSENISFLSVNGNWWKEQRRFSVQILRNHGYGKTKMEDYIKEEISIILDHLASLNGAVCDIREILVPSMSNIISAFIFGRRFEYDDPKRKYLDKRLSEFIEHVKWFDLKTFFPWMKPFLSALNSRYKTSTVELLAFIREEINNHKKRLDENNLQDYISSFLVEMRDRKKYDMLRGNVRVWFLGGSGTVRTTIEWCLLTMATYPDVQKRVQKEIDSVIGRERLPSWDDNVHFHYTQAVLYEVQRWQTIVPLSLLRYTNEDSTVQGYNIPKGTTVINNIWAVHNDPRYWKKPNEFFPEHFLSQDGTTFVKSEYFIPFCVGKRSCPGEKMAIVEIFLYFVSILQRFTVALSAGEKPNFDGICEVTWDPKFHHLMFLSR
ncbi:cytochrome P450 2J4-like [Tachypleus tridentatus]|uniref:cytochrome P450 2J4-like n=1 Tax=Tachypleus tridentatus TaxID=6853 RepID=UPI003FD2D180